MIWVCGRETHLGDAVKGRRGQLEMVFELDIEHARVVYVIDFTCHGRMVTMDMCRVQGTRHENKAGIT